MSHSSDVAQDKKEREVVEEKMEKVVAPVPPGEGASSLWVMGVLMTHKIPSRRTGGAYALFEVTTRPGTGPPPHIHHREDEAFYVLEGDYDFLIGGKTLRVGADSLLYVPKGTLHAHRAIGGGEGRMLLTQTPGGSYERFFEAVGKPAEHEGRPLASESQPDMRRIVQIAAEHGIEIPVPITRRSGG